MRALLASVLTFGVLAAAPSALADAAQDARFKRAYDTATRCFVANGFVRHRFTKSGDQANAALFESRAKQAHDVAHGYGRALHISVAEVSQNMKAVSARELPKLMSDATYLTEVAKACKAEGLM